MTTDERREITFTLGQLRHLYTKLGTPPAIFPRVLADGLLSPEIARLERLVEASDRADVELRAVEAICCFLQYIEMEYPSCYHCGAVVEQVGLGDYHCPTRGCDLFRLGW